eukprot:1282992-Prymnesium_polylepis.1
MQSCLKIRNGPGSERGSTRALAQQTRVSRRSRELRGAHDDLLQWDGQRLCPRARYTRRLGVVDGQRAQPTVKRPPPIKKVPQYEKVESLPPFISHKHWSKRSIKEMADEGAVPAGLPHGLREYNKKLWLALMRLLCDLMP